MWKVKFYSKENGNTPVKDFLESLPKKEEAKTLRLLKIIEAEEIHVGYPNTSAITGYRPMREVRVRFGKNLVRIFYFLYIKNTFILLHGFKKKTGKLPVGEIEIAYKRMKDYLKRYGK